MSKETLKIKDPNFGYFMARKQFECMKFEDKNVCDHGTTLPIHRLSRKHISERMRNEWIEVEIAGLVEKSE